MLSAATESTTVGAACLVAMARVFCDWNEVRTCTASRVCGEASAGASAACAGACIQPATAMPSASDNVRRCAMQAGPGRHRKPEGER